NEILPNLSSHITVNTGTFKTSNAKKFHTQPVSEEELNQIIMSFPNKYSAGHDEIPMPIVKQAKMYLIKPLTH
ncbi:hypothetical protein J6590_107812, partial [Homalodisca vitripennis]